MAVQTEAEKQNIAFTTLSEYAQILQIDGATELQDRITQDALLIILGYDTTGQLAMVFSILGLGTLLSVSRDPNQLHETVCRKISLIINKLTPS